MLSTWHFIKTMRTELELIQQLVMKYESSFCAANGTGSRRSSTHDFGFNTWNTHTAYTIHTPATQLLRQEETRSPRRQLELYY